MSNVRYLSKEIYRESDIEKAKEAFSSIAEIQIKDNGGRFICLCQNSVADITQTLDEFENYVIALSNGGIDAAM